MLNQVIYCVRKISRREMKKNHEENVKFFETPSFTESITLVS